LSHSGAGLASPEIRCSGVREAVNHASMRVAASWLPGKGDFHPFREHAEIAVRVMGVVATLPLRPGSKRPAAPE
jgi:hypothetical protein